MRLYLLIIHLFFLNLNLFGQSAKDINRLEYVYTNFTTRDGLPSNETYCVLQDSRGYIWIGTDRGLVKYDGYEFKIYTTEDGLTSNVIFGIAEDSNGNIWMTTSNLTLCYITPNEVIKESNKGDLGKLMDIHNIHNGFFDTIKIENDSLLLSHYEFGFLEISLITSKIIRNGILDYNVNDSLNCSSNIGVHIVNNNYQNNIFISAHVNEIRDCPILYNQQLLRYVNVKNNSFEQRPYSLQDSLYYFNNSIYIIKNKDIVEVIPLNYRIHAFRSNQYTFINKLDKYNKRGDVFIVDNILDESSWVKLLNRKIRLTSAIEDNKGGFWFTSVEHGLFYVPSKDNRIIKRGVNVKGILPYGDNTMFLGRGNQKYIYNINGEVVIHYHPLSIASIMGGKDKNITLSHPIQIPEITNWILKNEALSSKDISTFLIRQNRIKVLSGTKLIDIVKGKYIRTLFHNWHLSRLYALDEIDSNQIVFGYKNGKISIFKNDSIYPYIIDGYTLKYDPRDLKYTKESKILAVSTIGNGLFLFKNGSFLNKLTVEDGLISNTINQLMLDDNNRLWIGTNKGINYIDINANDSISIGSLFATSRGLLSPNVQQMYMLNDSIMLIGTDNGLNEVNVLGLEREKKSDVPLFINMFSVNDSLEFKKEFDYDENDITVTYTALEFNRYGNINYRYRLKGLSNNWISTKERKAVFTGVIPGHYIFELDVQNEYGDWISLEHPPEFTIRKPYWKTWWFIGSITLIGILIIGGALYYYISNLKKEKVFLENEQQLSNELNESQQKALSAQLNPHFVFNSLNSIQNFILTKRTELSSDYLSMFSKLMRFVFENSKKLYVPLSDEIEALRLYLELEQVRHNHKFKYEITSENHLKTSEIFLPSLLIQPIIENAIWHGLLHKIEGDRLLVVNFSSKGEYLYIEVKDNGVGRGVSKPRPQIIKKQRSSGVELTKQRLHLLSQSTGLSTHFEIIDLCDETNNSSGTCVQIKIPINLVG